MLQLMLFGTPRITRDGAIIPVQRTRALALLAYLAVIRQPQDREALLGLLWPEFDEASARNNLRRDLSVLRSALGDELLLADRLRVGWNEGAASVDVASFHAHLTLWRQHAHADHALCPVCAATLAEAVRLYRDDFLAGFGVPDSPAFEEWQFFQREELRQHLAAATQALSSWHDARGEYDAALGYARRWLALDPLHEPAQRALMRLYAQAGQHAAALRQFEESARLLDRELGAEPEAATIALRAQIRARTFPRQADVRPEARDKETSHSAVSASPGLVSPSLASPPLSPAAQPRHNLAPMSGFVGRARELADVIRRLTDPQCRLLTLVGPGGIGKTRLALESARSLADTWAGDDEIADGVLFVPLIAVDTSSGLFSALAAAARLDFYPNTPPQQQVLDFFRAKRVLIVLDNFEQLADEVAFIAELLAAAPGLRLLVTSRVALNLHDEWFHPLDGLAFPADERDSLAQLARYDAVRLFEQHARRARGDFSLARERAHVLRLCQLVAGGPLALELAASWLKLLPVEQVVAALERGLDVLSTTSQSIPERHRSMRAVLEESWRLLAPDEQPVLARLAVFSGGFSTEAAEAVAGANLAVLASLVDKSLLRSVGARFQFHELLRQFAAEQLAADARQRDEAETRHSVYYLGFVAEWASHLEGDAGKVAADAIAAETANVRIAWERAVERGDVAHLDRALLGYVGYYYARNEYLEGAEVFEKALSVKEDGSPDGALIRSRFLAQVRLRYGAFCVCLGNYATAVRELERGLAAAQELAMGGEVAFANLWLGTVARWRGDVAAARAPLEDALAQGWAIGDTRIVAQALQLLAGIASSMGDYKESDRLAHESLAFGRLARRADLMVDALTTLAWSAVCRGAYDAAEAHYRESLVLAERAGDEIGLSRAYGGIGWVAWCVGGERLAEARAHLERSVAIERKRGARLWIANYLGDLALVAIDEGTHEAARAYAEEGLAFAQKVDSAIYTVYHLGLLGRVAALRHEPVAARRYLGAAIQTASEASLWSQLALSLYHTAELLAAADDSMVRALELFAALAHHPAAWHVIQARSQRRIAELARALPADVVEAALARGSQLGWQAGVTSVLGELASL